MDNTWRAQPFWLSSDAKSVSKSRMKMRVLTLALAPNEEGLSFTSAKMAICQDNVWQPPFEMTMEAYLSKTPSFEYSVPETPYRFVVMQRRIVPAANENEP